MSAVATGTEINIEDIEEGGSYEFPKGTIGKTTIRVRVDKLIRSKESGTNSKGEPRWFVLFMGSRLKWAEDIGEDFYAREQVYSGSGLKGVTKVRVTEYGEGPAWYRKEQARSTGRKKRTGQYPISIEIAEGTLENWRSFYEYGSWEDHGMPERGEIVNGKGVHVKPILDDLNTRVRIDNQEELLEVLVSASYWGEEGLHDQEHATHAAITRFRQRLLAECDKRDIPINELVEEHLTGAARSLVVLYR